MKIFITNSEQCSLGTFTKYVFPYGNTGRIKVNYTTWFTEAVLASNIPHTTHSNIHIWLLITTQETEKEKEDVCV